MSPPLVRNLISDSEEPSNNHTDVVSTLKPEIQSVVGVVGTVASPVTTLAFSVINSLPAGSLVTSELTTLVGDLQTLVNGLLAPVEGLLAGLGLNL